MLFHNHTLSVCGGEPASLQSYMICSISAAHHRSSGQTAPTQSLSLSSELLHRRLHGDLLLQLCLGPHVQAFLDVTLW